MELIERVLLSLRERREKILKGEVNCIPSPFNRFRSEFAGIEQGRYYLISGGTKSGKTQFTSYLFVYNSILYSYYNPTKVKTTIFYYPLEETAEEIMLRFMSFLLNRLSKGTIHISPEDLKSTREDNPVSEEVLNILESEEYQKILKYFQECMNIQDSRNPTGVWKDLNAYALANGTVVKRKYQVKDTFEEKEAFDYYIPNNPNEYVIIVFDHASLLETERGMSLRESICKLSEYFVVLRNRYNFIPVLVQQQSTETLDLEAFKNNKIRPTVSGIADGKYTARDASVFFGITNPFAFELPSYLGLTNKINYKNVWFFKIYK